MTQEKYQHSATSTGNLAGEGVSAYNLPALSRRAFLAVAAGSAAAIASSALSGCTSKESSSNSETSTVDKTTLADSELEAISVSTDAVFTTEDYTYLESTDGQATLSASTTLPFGSVVFAGSGNTACVLLPGDTGNPLLQVALLNLQNATTQTILESAQSAKQGYQIYDARANDNGVVWLEADILEDKWRIYTARITNGSLNNIQLALEANSDWETPSIAISGNRAFWQMQPNSDGSAAGSNSILMCIELGASESNAQSIYYSPGKFACAPAPTKQGVAVAPKMSTSSTQYKLLHIDASSLNTLDILALPTTMKPYCIGYGTSGFSFAFSAIYEAGGGISNLGTYTPSTPSATEVTANTTWFRFPRTPICSPAWCGDLFFVKSTSVVAGANFNDKTYFSIDAQGSGESYGEYLASAGSVDKIVTFANLNYTPISGDAVKECQVRIWQA